MWLNFTWCFVCILFISDGIGCYAGCSNSVDIGVYSVFVLFPTRSIFLHPGDSSTPRKTTIMITIVWFFPGFLVE